MSVYLSVENVLQLREDTLLREGGLPGVRDLGALESAVAQPQQGMFGQELHPTLASKAGAYLFHIAMNHPFVDGNKRTAAMAAVVFLLGNGMVVDDYPSLEALTLDVAAGDAAKADAIAWFEAHTSLRPSR
jgi:death-on-curing protein